MTKPEKLRETGRRLRQFAQSLEELDEDDRFYLVEGTPISIEGLRGLAKEFDLWAEAAG